jgi:ATP-dependent protease ClpP protease subunit
MPNQLRDWFRFVTNKAQPDDAEVYIYGDIGDTFWGDGVSAQSFVDELNGITAKKLSIRINSPGGSAYDGLTIANAIVRHSATTTTWIDGLAASAASIVAMAGDEVVMSKYGEMMLHNAHALVMGTSKDMREVAAQLDQLNASIASFYADRSTTSDDAAAFARAMSKETWYNADEALEAGLVTRIDTSAVREETEKAVASALARTAETYRYSGRQAAPAPVATTKESPVADKKTIAESLGLPADASEDDILAKTREALGIKDDPKPADDPKDPKVDDPAPKVEGVPAPADPGAPESAAAAARAKANGEVVELDKATYEQMMANAQLGAKAHATLTAQAHAQVVDKALDEGRITLARRDHYMSLMTADPADTIDLLTKRLQPGAAVPLTEIGHMAEMSAKNHDDPAEDPKFKAWKV